MADAFGPATPEELMARAVAWPEVGAGDDLGAMVAAVPDLRDGDVVALTSKVVSKAEGRRVDEPRAAVVDSETARVVARRGDTVIARTRHGFVLAAAGVDTSNVPGGATLALPLDPDASAGRIRAAVWKRRGVNVGVVVTDTAGRAWRTGQTDLAIGVAGLPPLLDLAGAADSFGAPLLVTMPAVADEIASAADLVKGKATGRPLAIVRGWSGHLLPPGDDGPGARALVRDADGDLFGLGAREAVEAAVAREPADAGCFPARVAADPPPFARLRLPSSAVRARIEELPGDDRDGPAGWVVAVDVATASGEPGLIAAGRVLEAVEVLAAAHRLHAAPAGADDIPTPGWRTVSRTAWLLA